MRRREGPRQYHTVCGLSSTCPTIISPACHHALPWAARREHDLGLRAYQKAPTARGGRDMTPQPPGQRPKPSAHVHPDGRDRIEGLKAIGAFLQGAPQPQAPLSYYTPILIQCTLPHSDPKTPSYAKTNGDFSLIVSSGFDSDGKPYGVPYGSFPRLVLAYIITRVIESGERCIELEEHFSGFLRAIGYTGNFRGNTRASRAI